MGQVRLLGGHRDFEKHAQDGHLLVGDSTVANIRLSGNGDSYVIAVDFWNEVIDWAQEHGWSPEHDFICYRGEFPCDVSDEDSANLADILEFIAGDIVLHEYQVPDDFLRHLLDTLLKLTIFFHAGGFSIAPVPSRVAQ